MQLTQKETDILNDLKRQEEICIEKYQKYSNDANDQQLKNLFTYIGSMEQHHLDTLNQILGGTVPSMEHGENQQPQQPSFTPTYTTADPNPQKQQDCYLCTDLLSSEKHVSSTYDSAIFDFNDTNIRDALNHIQKEEQQHGAHLYDYKVQNAMC